MTALHKEKFEREKLKILSKKERDSKECGGDEDEGSLEGASSDKESEHTKESETPHPPQKKEKKRKQRVAIKKIREKMKRCLRSQKRHDVGSISLVRIIDFWCVCVLLLQ